MQTIQTRTKEETVEACTTSEGKEFQRRIVLTGKECLAISILKEGMFSVSHVLELVKLPCAENIQLEGYLKDHEQSYSR